MITVTVCFGGEFNHNLLGGKLGRTSAVQKADAPRRSQMNVRRATPKANRQNK